MKKLILVLSLLACSINVARAQEPGFETDPYDMVLHLQRVMNTSKNPQDIIEAERLIREVYGPLCSQRYWKRVKMAVVGTASFIALFKVTGKFGLSLGGTAGILGYMALKD